MKTIEEFIQEISSSESLQNEISAITDKDILASFLTGHGCEASVKEFVDKIRFLSSPDLDGAELDEESLCAVTGGNPIRTIAKLMPKALHAIKNITDNK